jgi:hypothetical protein
MRVNKNNLFTIITIFIVIIVTIKNVFFNLQQDDYYIYLKYVKNFIELGVPHFNIGENYNGFSSIGYFLILSLIYKIFPFLHIYLIPSLFFLFYNFYLSIKAFKIENKRVFLLIYILNPFLSYWYFSGMETYFSITFFLLNLIMIRKKKYKYFFLINTSSIFFRPEIIIISFVSFIFYIVDNKKIKVSIKNIIGSIIFPSLFISFLIVYFENIIPLSIQAKKNNLIQYDLIISIKNTFQNLFGWTRILEISYLKFSFFFLIMSLIVILLLKIKKIDLNNTFVFSILISFCLYLISIGGGYNWYYSLPIFIICYYSYLGIISFKNNRNKSLFIFIFFLCLSNFSYVKSRNEYVKSVYIDLYKQSSLFLNSLNLDPKTNIFVGSLGYFGFYSNYIVNDYIGLVSPEMIEIIKDNNGDTMSTIKIMNPEILVVKLNTNKYTLNQKQKNIFENYNKIKSFYSNNHSIHILIKNE